MNNSPLTGRRNEAGWPGERRPVIYRVQLNLFLRNSLLSRSFIVRNFNEVPRNSNGFIGE